MTDHKIPEEMRAAHRAAFERAFFGTDAVVPLSPDAEIFLETTLDAALTAIAPEIGELVGAAEDLTSACENEFTGATTTEGGDAPCLDNESVFAGDDGKEKTIRFGMIRRARAALSKWRKT